VIVWRWVLRHRFGRLELMHFRRLDGDIQLPLQDWPHTPIHDGAIKSIIAYRWANPFLLPIGSGALIVGEDLVGGI